MNPPSFVRYRFHVISGLVIIAMALLLGAFSKAKGQDLPNIILFLVDDMGLMDTSASMLTDEDGNPQ